MPRYRDGRCHRKTQVGSGAKQKAPGEDAEKQTRGSGLRQLCHWQCTVEESKWQFRGGGNGMSRDLNRTGCTSKV